MSQLLTEGAPATLDNDANNTGSGTPYEGITDKLDIAKSATYTLSGIDSTVKHAEAGSSLTMEINGIDYSVHFVEDAASHMPPPNIQPILSAPEDNTGLSDVVGIEFIFDNDISVAEKIEQINASGFQIDFDEVEEILGTLEGFTDQLKDIDVQELDDFIENKAIITQDSIILFAFKDELPSLSISGDISLSIQPLIEGGSGLIPKLYGIDLNKNLSALITTLDDYNINTSIGIAGNVMSDFGAVFLANHPSITTQTGNLTLTGTTFKDPTTTIAEETALTGVDHEITDETITGIELLGNINQFDLSEDILEMIERIRNNAVVQDLSVIPVEQPVIDVSWPPQSNPITTFTPTPARAPYGARVKDMIVTDTEVTTTYEWTHDRYIDVSGDDADSYNAQTIAEMFVEMLSEDEYNNIDRYRMIKPYGNNTGYGEITVTSANNHFQDKQISVSLVETGGDTGAMVAVSGASGDTIDLASGGQPMQDLETDVSVDAVLNDNVNRITIHAGVVTEGTSYKVHFGGNDIEYIAQKGDTINEVVDGLRSVWHVQAGPLLSQDFYERIRLETVKPSNPLTQNAYLDFEYMEYGFYWRPDGSLYDVADPDFTVSTYEGKTQDIVKGMRDGSALIGTKQVNTVDYSDQDVRFHIDLDTNRRATGQWVSSGDANMDYDHIAGFHNILSGSGNDYLEGSGTENNKIDNQISGGDGDDMIFGRHGDDILIGGMGNDTLYGGFDDDTLYGGLGNDMLLAGAGDDTILDHGGNDRIYGDSGDDIIKVLGGDNVIFGGAGDDYIYLSDAEFFNDFAASDRDRGEYHNQVWGGAGNDTIIGGSGHNDLYGGAGDDFLSGSGTLSGHDGDDILRGHYDSDDFLYGQNGADTFFASGGKDYMFSGGADGAEDRFVFDSGHTLFDTTSEDIRDRVVGFETGIDKIHLGQNLVGFWSEDIETQALSIVQSMHGPNIYDVSLAAPHDEMKDFGLLVTTTGGTLTANDFVMNSTVSPWMA